MKYSIHNIDQEKISKKPDAYIDFIKEKIGKEDFDHHEDVVNVPFNVSVIQDMNHFVEDTMNEKLRYLFVIGIGGSILGPKAIHTALGEKNDVVPVWVDSVEENQLKEIQEIIEKTSEKEEIAIIVSSKSGKTTEPLINAGNILNFFEEKYKHIYDRVSVVTNKETPLDIWADEHDVERFHIPEIVGGRYSVFTAIGILPLIFLGHDVNEIIRGAQESTGKFSNNAFSFESALAIYASYKNGQDILNTFLFGSQYEDLGKWYSQLVGESLGKERDIENRTVHTGITPVVSIGSRDLHSVGQLYIGGPKDKMTIFISDSKSCDIEITRHSISREISYTENKKVSSINKAILKGVSEVYEKNDLPFINIEFENHLERELGYFMQSLMMQVMIIGHMMNINAFNQPNVESYKKITREILKKE